MTCMLGNGFSSTNSDDEQRIVKTKVTSEHKKWRESKYKLHTYVQAYIIYTIIYPWFSVLSLIVSCSLPIIAYIITTVELCVCLCVCVCMTFIFILIFYHHSAFYDVMPVMILYKTVASCTNFRDDVSAFMAWSRSTSGWIHRFTS